MNNWCVEFSLLSIDYWGGGALRSKLHFSSPVLIDLFLGSVCNIANMILVLNDDEKVEKLERRREKTKRGKINVRENEAQCIGLQASDCITDINY